MPISHQIASIIHISCGTCTSRDFIQLFSRLFLGVRKVAYALLTHPPLVSSPKTLLPFDLHVLSLPQAFILSQDQTLHCKKLTLPVGRLRRHPVGKICLPCATCLLCKPSLVCYCISLSLPSLKNRLCPTVRPCDHSVLLSFEHRDKGIAFFRFCKC